ncbi:hypothetical protein RUM44_008088 [Polyplax serrata]|uniref:Aminotransferase class I/classII large domain-containing protein n=1 Tax=Polyplax serrata TaxID=468196 RepID=A0ABR1B7N7_POLSC
MSPNKPKESAETNVEQQPIDYDYFVNDFSKLRQPSVIRELNKLYSQKTTEMISLAGGLPNTTTFPFEEIAIRLNDGSCITLKERILHDSLQYIPTQGYPPLLEKLREIVWQHHRPPSWDLCEILVTPGAQDGICKAVEMSLREGEAVIVQNPTYSGTACLLEPFRPDLIFVDQDENGVIPEQLEDALEKRVKSKMKLPKMMYVNPTGANPTGVVLSTQRKREVYRLACKYNFIILEDDPYFYLYFDDKRPVSFLSIDTEGRVLRFDSFSKIMSPGFRVGFCTGPKHLIGRIELHVQAASLHAASLPQVIIDKVIDTWGYDKLFAHIDSIRNYYKSKRDLMIEASNKYLTGIAEWNTPTAGMFLWIKVKGIPDTKNLVCNECIKEGVMFVMGHAYYMEKDKACQYVRACFSLATPEQIDIGMQRLATAIRREQKRYGYTPEK